MATVGELIDAVERELEHNQVEHGAGDAQAIGETLQELARQLDTAVNGIEDRYTITVDIPPRQGYALTCAAHQETDEIMGLFRIIDPVMNRLARARGNLERTVGMMSDLYSFDLPEHMQAEIIGFDDSLTCPRCDSVGAKILRPEGSNKQIAQCRECGLISDRGGFIDDIPF